MSIEIEPLTDELVDASIAVIRAGQAASGAYVASPTFSQYGFAWLRDGSFVALAMDVAGDRESSERFHAWTAKVVAGRADRIATILAKLEAGEHPGAFAMLPTRYELDGTDEPHDAEWPNFQLDGYGTWLFALHAHFDGTVPGEYLEPVRLAADYLSSSWALPCYDYWEEFGDRIHTSTLASIAAGLRSSARILRRPEDDAVADEIVAFMRERCVVDGSFVKGPEDDRVDASLISIRTPFALVPANDPVMAKTVDRIRSELSSPTGGVRRYLGDTYYGGSPWILLTAWLGWHDRAQNRTEGARSALAWVQTRASARRTLAEQDVTEPQAPEWVADWEARWGPIADPLLWSHAKYLLLELGGAVKEWR